MKKLLVLGLCVSMFLACNHTSHTTTRSQTGVWVSNDAELLLTDSVMLYFERQPDSTVLGVVKVKGLAEDYAFFKRDTVLRSPIPAEFQVGEATGNTIIVNGKSLTKAEEVTTCPPIRYAVPYRCVICSRLPHGVAVWSDSRFRCGDKQHFSGSKYFRKHVYLLHCERDVLCACGKDCQYS